MDTLRYDMALRVSGVDHASSVAKVFEWKDLGEPTLRFDRLFRVSGVNQASS